MNKNLIKDRNVLLDLFPKNKKIAELGVYRGDFSKIILDKLMPQELYLVDIFTGIGYSGDKDGLNPSQENLDEVYYKLINLYKNNNNVTIIKDTSVNFLKSLPDEYLDIVYIDADHSYESVKSDLELSLKKVKKDGIIFGHDYCYNIFNDQVTQAVNDFCKENNRQVSLLTEDRCPTFVIVNTPIENNNKLNNFPIVNCISLIESQDRRYALQKQFNNYNIHFINFLISNRFIESENNIQGKFINTLNDGTKGCCVSHIKNIKRWLETTTEPYGFFCEDDLSLETVQYWDKTWKEFIENLPQDWECVQLLTIRKDKLSLSVRDRIWDDWGATAYILKRGYAEKIINNYCIGDTFKLELPELNSGIQPLIENLLFTIGKTYTVSLFVENIDFKSTFVETDTDIDAATLHKNNHVIAAQKTLSLWRSETSAKQATIKELYDYSTNIDNPECNFKMGEYYLNQGHTAPALSYFLRCAERTENKNLAYEALIHGYMCYREQKIRDETAKSLIMHAVCLLPERPEARWILSVFFEQKSEWMYAYYHACRGLETCNQEFEPLKHYKEYPGEQGLLFQQAIAGYWWGKNDECKNILLDLRDNYQLTETYKEGVKNNLKRLGIEST
jgi:hypothetical protein